MSVRLLELLLLLWFLPGVLGVLPGLLPEVLLGSFPGPLSWLLPGPLPSVLLISFPGPLFGLLPPIGPSGRLAEGLQLLKHSVFHRTCSILFKLVLFYLLFIKIDEIYHFISVKCANDRRNTIIDQGTNKLL